MAPNTSLVFTNAFMVESNERGAHAVIVMLNAAQGFSNDPLQFEIASLTSRIHEILTETT